MSPIVEKAKLACEMVPWLLANGEGLKADYNSNEHAREIVKCYKLLSKTFDGTIVLRLQAAIAKYKESIKPQ